MGNQLIDQLTKGLGWQRAWTLRLRLMDSKCRLPRGFPAFKLTVSVEGPHEVDFAISNSATSVASIRDLPEATLGQLGLRHAALGDAFKPAYCAMDDGIDGPGGCWHLFEELPTFDPVCLEWHSEGNTWEIGLDPSDDLCDTPEFQRWVKPGFSLVRIVEKADIGPRYHPLAMMDQATWTDAKADPIPPAGWRPCSPELLESGVDCGAAPRWSAGPIGQHWHPPVSEPCKQAGEVQ